MTPGNYFREYEKKKNAYRGKMLKRNKTNIGMGKRLHFIRESILS